MRVNSNSHSRYLHTLKQQQLKEDIQQTKIQDPNKEHNNRNKIAKEQQQRNKLDYFNLNGK